MRHFVIRITEILAVAGNPPSRVAGQLSSPGEKQGVPMRNLINVAIAATMASLFVVMFWAQVGVIATAVAQAKPETYAATSNPYLPIQMLEPVY